MPCSLVRCFTSVSSVPGDSLRKCTSSMKARIRNTPRPDPRRMFSGDSGSGMLSASKPLPWSLMRKIRSPSVASRFTLTSLSRWYALPWMTAFTAASRTAMAMFETSSSWKPNRRAKPSASCSTRSTDSSVEASLRLVRVVGVLGKALQAGRDLTTVFLRSVRLAVPVVNSAMPPL